MKYSEIITEELHERIKSILDSQTIPASHKYSNISSTLRSLKNNNMDTGLESDKPKKGSARLVYFPQEGHHVEIDGHKVEAPTALKVAYKGPLEKYRTGALLGEHQNRQESYPHTQEFSVLKKVGNNKYESNPHGVFTPVFDSHDEDHWVLHGRIKPIGKGDFRRLTKTDKFPEGISSTDFKDALVLQHHDAHGTSGYFGNREDHLRNIHNHPLVENATDAMFSTGVNPDDFDKRNMGIWEHPVTKKEHLVISDYGYTDEIGKMYNEARKEAHRRQRGY